MSVRKNRGDSKGFWIAILVVVVIVQALLLFKPELKKLPAIKKPAKPVVVKPKIEKKVEKPIAGRIAIVIDDWGYNSSHCDLLAEIKSPVSVAILPNLPHSADVARCAHAQGKEVMLHLPLEPHKILETYPRDYLIMTTMSKDKIERILEKHLASVPYAEGVNNHTGSAATEDRRLMSIIFNKLKEKNLFFLDSLVTSQSICRRLAKEASLPFAERDIFLDNENTRTAIEEQFALLAEEAQTKGYATAIGHDRPLSLRIIKEQTQKLQQEGFKFISAGDLAK